ncbi:MAG: Ig-like domain-containing protein, partial [Micrococcales bacterium]|nr:Ig-like domain-containing protein [Micrococcales bacterium]
PINGGSQTTVTSDPTTGIASVPMTTTKAGTHTVHAALVTPSGEVTVKNSGNIQVTWTAERTPDWTKTMLTGTDNETRVVGGVEYHSAKVEVRDRFNNPIPNLDVTLTNTGVGTWKTTETNPSAPRTLSTNALGVVTIDIVSNVANSAIIGASINSIEVTNGGASPARLAMVFTAGVPSAEMTTLNGTTEVKLAGNPSDPHRAWVDVRDVYGNPVTGPAVRVSFALSGLLGAQATPSSPVTVDAAGRAEVAITAPLAGKVQVRATVTAPGVTSMAVVKPADHLVQEFATTNVDTTKSDYTVTTGSLEANGTAAHYLTVRLRDERGVPVQGSAQLISVAFTARGIAEGIPQVGEWVEGSASQNQAGNYTAPITSTFADIFDLRVLVGEPIAPAAGSPSFVTFHPGAPSTDTSSYEVTTGTKTANGVEKHTVTVTLKDAQGNLISGAAASLSATATPAVVGSFTAHATQQGIYTANITSTKAGLHDVTVTIAGVRDTLDAKGANRIAAFVAGTPDASKSLLELTTTNPQLVISGTHTAKVTLRDAQSNVIADQRLRVWTVPAIAMTADGFITTDINGVANISFTTSVPGTYKVYAEAAGVQPSGSGVIEAVFVNGPIDSAKSWFTVSQTAGVVADGNPAHFQMLTVKLMDAAGAGIVGEVETLRDSVSFSPAGPIAWEFTEVAGEQGIYEAKLTSTKSGSFTVSVTAKQDGASKSIIKLSTGNDIATFVAGEAVAIDSVLSASPLTLTVGQVSTAQVAVVDKFGNPVPGQKVRFWTDPTGPIVEATSTVTSNSATGIASMTMTTTRAGTYTVYAALVTASGEVAVRESGNVDVQWTAERTPDWSKTMLTGTNNQTRRIGGVEYHEAKVEVRDRFNNPIDELEVTFSNTGIGTWKGNQANPTAPWTLITNASGTVNVEIISTKVGNAIVGASVGTTAVTNGGTGPKRLTMQFVPRRSAPEAPIVDETDGHEVTGEGEPGTIVTITDPDGNVIGEGIVDEDGTWTVIVNPDQKEGDVINVTLTDEDGQVSEPTQKRVGKMRVTIAVKKLYRGETQVATVLNLESQETVSAAMHSQPIELGTAKANKDFKAIFTFKIPETAELGFHTVVVRGANSRTATSEKFEVVDRPEEPTPSPTPPASTTPPPSTTPTPSPTPTPVQTPNPTETKTVVPVPTHTVIVTKQPIITGWLSNTGAETVIPSIAAGFGMLLAGLILFLAARRRRSQEDTRG